MKKTIKNTDLISLDACGRIVINDFDLMKAIVGAKHEQSPDTSTDALCGKNLACGDLSCSGPDSEKKDKKNKS